MRFFFDASLSSRLAKAVALLAEGQRIQVVALADMFSANTPDPVWLRDLSQDADWIIVSADERISRGKAERQAWKDSGLTAFFFASGYASRGPWTQAKEMCHWWPMIVERSRRANPGSGYLMPFGGSEFRDLYPSR